MLGSILILLSGFAMAQDVPEPVYRPAIDSQTTFMTESTGLVDDRGATARVVTSLADEPFAYTERRDDVANIPVVSRTDLIGGFQLGPVRIGADVPIYGMESTVVNNDTVAGLGDVAFDVRGTLTDERNAPLGIALAGRGWVPSNNTDPIFSNDAGSWSLAAYADRNLGPVYLAANAGISDYNYTPSDGDTFGDDAFVRLAASAGFLDRFGAMLDFAGHWTYEDSDLSPGINDAPLTGLIGGWAHLTDAIDLRAAFGGTIGVEDERANTNFLPTGSLMLNYTGQDRRDRDLDGFANRVDHCPDVYGVDEFGCPVEETVAAVAPQREVLIVEREIRVPVEPKIELVETELQLDETIYFAFDSDQLTPKAQAVLNEVATELQANPMVDLVWIKGHADERGTAEYNVGLSQRRAKAVYDYLIQQGVSETRLDTVAFGESRPADPRSTPAAWQKNRRVEFEAVDEAPN